MLLVRILRKEFFRFGELSTLFWFVVLIGLWILRDPKFMTGWGAFFKPGFVKDSTAAMLIAVILFAWPRSRPDFSGICIGLKKNKVITFSLGNNPPPTPLVTWSAVQHRFQWGVIMLLGGGFALAEGVRVKRLERFWRKTTNYAGVWSLSANKLLARGRS